MECNEKENAMKKAYIHHVHNYDSNVHWRKMSFVRNVNGKFHTWFHLCGLLWAVNDSKQANNLNTNICIQQDSNPKPFARRWAHPDRSDGQHDGTLFQSLIYTYHINMVGPFSVCYHWRGFSTRNAHMVHIVNLIRLKMGVHLSRSLYLNFNYLVSVTAGGPVTPRGHM